jgi:hypothetical protein
MKISKILLAAAAAAVLATSGAVARDRDRDGRPDHSYAERHDRDGFNDRGRNNHDRYWQQGYRSYVGRDVVFRSLRARHYNRWVGDPYWFQGRYVIKSYDRRGRIVFVEINPYTGAFVGEVRF